MSRESEVAVLSACLADNRAVFDVSARCDASEFVDPACAAVWAAFQRLHAERLPIDAATVIPRLAKGFGEHRAFGEALVAGYSAANVTVYANAIRDAAVRRRVVVIANDLAGCAES